MKILKILLKLLSVPINLFTSLIYSPFFSYQPKNSKKIYSQIIAHRGLHIFFPENTLGAYDAAVRAKMAVELDVRITKDNELVCFHDRYTKRLLKVPGKLSMFRLEELKNLKVLESNEGVPTLKMALKKINNRVDILVEVKGRYTKSYSKKLEEIQKEYDKTLYFHTKNLINYFKLKRQFPKVNNEKRVYLVSDIFRKRFIFLKGKDYKGYLNKYNELLSNVDIEIPSIEDISNIIVKNLEKIEDKKLMVATLGAILNNYETRVKKEGKNSWVFNSLWLHRGILSNRYKEHSRDSFIACRDFAIRNNLNITVEFDVMLYKGEIRCYHRDKISSILGQSKSCAEKMKLKESLRLSEILEIFNGYPNINLAIDIKDYHIKNRVLEDLIILELQKMGYTGNYIVMSYNPFVLSYFKENSPTTLRAQIGHSLKGLRRIPIFRFPTLINIFLGMLFDMSCADVIVFDDSNWIYYIIAYHKNIKGKPVLIYAPKSYVDKEAFIGKESVANFIVENIEDEASWPKEYILKFKKGKKGNK